MPTPAYRLARPETLTTGVVFSSPHSGRHYPRDFVEQSSLRMASLRSSEDAFVDDLFIDAPKYGAPLISAVVPRAYVDLNRSADELDPSLIRDVVTRGNNPRVAAGLGVIPRVVAEGRVIRRGKISIEEADTRIQTFYRPYHALLTDLLTQAQARFGEALLIDCHSMPREALSHTVTARGQRPDIVLGDRFGASCNLELVDEIEAIFINAGFRVARNTPFAGAFITQHYGRPSSGRHALQIEIDRSIYMDESRLEKRRDFLAVQARITQAIAEICDAFGELHMMAAE